MRLEAAERHVLPLVGGHDLHLGRSHHEQLELLPPLEATPLRLVGLALGERRPHAYPAVEDLLVEADLLGHLRRHLPLLVRGRGRG